MGAWAPDLSQKNHPTKGYGHFSFSSTFKWNIVYRRGTTRAGAYNYRTLVIVGGRENVRVAMRQLYLRVKP